MSNEEKSPGEIIQNQIIVEKKNRFERLLKILSIIIGIGLIIFFIILGINLPDFPVFWTILLVVGVIIIFSLTYFGFNIIRFFERSSKQKLEKDTLKQITIEQAREIRDSNLTHPQFADYTNGNISERIIIAGKLNKAPVYVSADKCMYENKIVYTCINMINPGLRACDFDLSPQQITNYVNSLVEPVDEPSIEEIEEKSPLLGIERITRKISPQNKDETQQKSIKEDLK